MARVLVVDDNLEMLEARVEAIAAEGHEVVAADSVEGALAALPADCVVADLKIPEVSDGLRLIRSVRASTPDARIIVSSGFTGYLDGHREKAMVDHLLQKPFPAAKLLALIRMLLAALALWAPARAADEAMQAIEAHAPILERRANVVGTPSDVPLFLYAERLRDEGGAAYVQYTVIFSHEDGGTSTPALLARWGRTTDIEHVYRVWLDAQGRRTKAIIQTEDHRDVAFEGPFEGDHPLLAVITDNNMVGPGGTGRERAALRPVVVDLSGASRERVMDDHPELYRRASEELAREGRIGAEVGDAREYFYVEAKIGNANTRVLARVRVGDVWYASDVGRHDWAIERSGWVRTAIRLPAGASPGEVAVECLAERKGEAGSCRVQALGTMFRLGEDYAPGRDVAPLSVAAFALRPGEARVWTLR